MGAVYETPRIPFTIDEIVSSSQRGCQGSFLNIRPRLPLNIRLHPSMILRVIFHGAEI
jgi:hypothetical protein